MVKRRKSTELRKIDIAQSVIAVLSENGFNRLTIRTIAERMNVTSAALYFHIKNKEEMLDLAMEEYRRARLELLATFRASDKKPLNRIRTMFSQEIQLAIESPGFFKFLLTEDLTDKQLTIMLDLDLYYRLEYKHVFNEAQKLGQIRSDIDPETIAKIYRNILLAGIIKFVKGNEDKNLLKDINMIMEGFFMMLKV